MRFGGNMNEFSEKVSTRASNRRRLRDKYWFRRLRKLGHNPINRYTTPLWNLMCYRDQGKPCSCFGCRNAKDVRKNYLVKIEINETLNQY